MLYSVGKDSSVMLHLARKAFYPCTPPFPLLHVDTTWKFREMYAFRDRDGGRARGWTCWSTSTRIAWSAGSTRSTTARPCTPSCGRPRASSRRWTQHGFDARVRRRAPRRGDAHAPRSASSRSAAAQSRLGPEAPAPRAVAALQRGTRARARPCACSRSRTGPSSTSGSTSTREKIPVVPLYFAARAPDRRARRRADHGRRRAHAARARRGAARCAACASGRWAATR